MSPVYQPMTFDNLSEICRVEKNKRTLAEVRPDLFRAMADLISHLRADYDRELSKDPESLMCEGASQRRKNADTLAKVIVETRTMKITALAMVAAGTDSVSVDYMTPEEKEFFDTIRREIVDHMGELDRIRDRKPRIETLVEEQVVDVPQPEPEPVVVTKHVEESEVPVPAPVQVEPIPEESSEDPEMEEAFFDEPDMQMEDMPDDSDAIFMGDMSQPPVARPPPLPPQEDDGTMVVLRVLEDLPPFVGPDRDYELSKEDVVTLPKVMADALVRAEKAVILRPTP